jgi:C-terminal processing protease CtpA/Prc/subtilisin family serine protease
MAKILRDYRLVKAKPVFNDNQIKREADRTNKLRTDVAQGLASIEYLNNYLSNIERIPRLDSFVRLHFPAGTPRAKVLEELNSLPEVTRVVEVPRAIPPIAPASALTNLQTVLANSMPPVPTDPFIGTSGSNPSPPPGQQIERQWYLHRTRVPQAWPFARGTNVVIADIDFGFRTTHQDIAAGIDITHNAVDGTTDVTAGNDTAHGTGVLGIAGARADGDGMAGYAPDARLWAIQANDANHQALDIEEPWAEAIHFVRHTAANGRRKVIVLEIQTEFLGNYEQVPSVNAAIRLAIADDIVVCVAAGNGNTRADLTDAGDPFDPTGSILVGATDFDAHINKRASFSNFGSRIVVSAPGSVDHDVTCANGSDHAYRNGFGGTSGATPKVAGTVALMLSANPNLTHHDVREILAGTGTNVTPDPGKPIGVFLNAEAAVAEAIRRRSDADADDLDNATTIPSPVARPTNARRLHGIRRRRSERLLPPSNDLSFQTRESLRESPDADETTEPGEQPPPGDKLLRVFRKTLEGTLTQQDRILIVNQAIRLLDNFYVHRPLKEAIHAVRPIQRLKVLQRRLQRETTIPESEQDELAFHNTVTQIFNSVRDLHTSYQLPRPYRDYIAYLPFEVAPFYEGGERRYMVTRVLRDYEFASTDFRPGVELLYWNGMAIERAVCSSSEQTAGSNDAARHARGVSALTLRPMNTALPPNADFIELEFVPNGADANDRSARRTMRQHWFVRYAPRITGFVGFPETQSRTALASRNGSVSSRALSAALGLDVGTDSVREARQVIFESFTLLQAGHASVGEETTVYLGSASPGVVDDKLIFKEIPVKSPWNAAFRARTVEIEGKTYGHIQIRTFYFEDVDGFVAEFVRLLERMPQRGLILDVRGNGGGSIWAAERLLQTLGPIEIEPERMQFIVSPGTLDLSRNNPKTSDTALDQWLPSLEEAVETGSVYSHAFSLTPKDDCNALGQKYYGPTVLIVDGNCYSATDIFAAGFQDHNIGKVLGVSENTGAGGANVWEHWLLNQTLPSGWGLKPLPGQASMRVAIRQCLRVGSHAGALLEDFGVQPDAKHRPTRTDLMEGDRELLARAAECLKERRSRSIKVTEHANGAGEGKVTLDIKTVGLKRLDFYLNGRPQGSENLELKRNGRASLTCVVAKGDQFLLTGYAEPGDPKPSALYRGKLDQ